MSIFGFLFCLIGYIIFSLNGRHEASVFRKNEALRMHPSGFELEATVYKKVFDEVYEYGNTHTYSEFLNKYREYNRCNVYLTARRYAEIAARIECLKQNLWPMCMYDIIYMAEKYKVDIYEENLMSAGGRSIEKMRALDEKIAREALNARKREGVWSGRWETYDEYIGRIEHEQ